MEWIKVSTEENPSYTKRVLALEPHEAKVLASAFELPLKDYNAEFEDLSKTREQYEDTTRQQDYRYLLLEEIIGFVSEFISLTDEMD